MLLSILLTLAFVCGREGSDVQDNADDEISNAAERDKNNTETQRQGHNTDTDTVLLQGRAKEWSLGCVNSCPVARGSQVAGFTQPRDHSFAQPCTYMII